ncbi:uncharacterized protein N7482_009559 [Penicillium canariense]|uniref:Uncharacterized protein n=1 Tax=Penicillium canariense TaxID=189055 RepID=A0A9W9LF09_9EURO|nr:uncharacterized protein N7482_009559 [Penicillium canariense]KAJ5153081.1 hypothetical protein N7482_009559 [Penicillium canariense]
MAWLFRTRVPRLRGERTPEEASLERGDDFNALQRYRLNVWERYGDEAPDSTVSVAFLRTEESLRKICQKEIALKEPKIPSQIRTLRELKRNAWFLEREWSYLRSEITESPSVLERAFKQWRSDPRWYMHSVLVEDCVNRGGCCSRSCGCCVSRERQTSSVGELGIGHCTVECGCCCEARGFDLTAEEKRNLEMRFGFLDMAGDGLLEDYVYQDRIYFASVWGLLRNATCHEYEQSYHKEASVPIFQSEPVKCEGASIVGDSETLPEDDPGEGSDSTIIVI